MSSVQLLSCVRLFVTPRTTARLPVHHQFPEFTQTHVHWVGVAIQPPHPLSSPSPPALNPSQHQGLFQWVSSSHQGPKVLELQLQHQSFQCTRCYFILSTFTAVTVLESSSTLALLSEQFSFYWQGSQQSSPGWIYQEMKGALVSTCASAKTQNTHSWKTWHC